MNILFTADGKIANNCNSWLKVAIKLPGGHGISFGRLMHCSLEQW